MIEFTEYHFVKKNENIKHLEAHTKLCKYLIFLIRNNINYKHITIQFSILSQSNIEQILECRDGIYCGTCRFKTIPT